jgi:hypothetical protein
MPRKASSTAQASIKWKDGAYVQIYVSKGVRQALKVLAAQRGTTIPDEVERLLLASTVETGRVILPVHGQPPVTEDHCLPGDV